MEDSISLTIHDAVRKSEFEAVKSILTSGSQNVNDKDKFKRTPLHIAAWAGDHNMIELLLRFKADPSAIALDGFTALHFAAQKENGALACEYLVKKSAKLLHAKISKGQKTALHVAISKGNTEVVKKLLDLGADPTTKTGSNQTCLDLCPTLNSEISDMLIKALSNRTKSKQTDHLEKTSVRDETHVNNTVETLTIQDDMQKQTQEQEDTIVNNIESDKNQPTISSASTRNSGEIDLIEPVKKKQKKIILSHLLDDEDDD